MQALQAAAVRLTLTIWFLNVSEHFGTCSTDILHHQISIAKHTLRIKLCSCSSKICLCCALSLKAKIQGSFPCYFVKRTCAMHHSTTQPKHALRQNYETELVAPPFPCAAAARSGTSMSFVAASLTKIQLLIIPSLVFIYCDCVPHIAITFYHLSNLIGSC